MEQIESSGTPFGMLSGVDYDEVAVQLERGDCVLFFSDGAFEIHNARDELLGIEGLARILQESGYPESGIQMAAIEEKLLRFSNAIRLDDDVTFIEARFA
jgi:serine phosphatase RsbU (regulator of sigma subunit)